jgi:dolichol-phosphate mannosyltransferase
VTGPDRTVVVVPTYNEAGSIGPLLDRIRVVAPDVDVLVVDDASPDGTGRLADEAAARNPRINVLHRTRKDGLGAAYLAGFGWALARDYGVIVQADADGSHRPEDLPRLLRALVEADLVLGSRYVPGGGVTNWSRRRELLSRSGNRYVRVLLGMPIRDSTGGYRAFRAAGLRRLDLTGVASRGYCFQVDMAWRAVRAGLRVVEVPITFVEREEGTSKMTGAIVREALWRVTQWGLTHRWKQLRSAVGGGSR